MKLRPIATGFLSCRLKSGNQASFWYDHWTSNASLLSQIGQSGQQIIGIPINSSVRDTLSNGEWPISSRRNPTLSLLRGLLPSSPPPISQNLEDEYVWKSSSTTTSSKFSASSTSHLLQPPLPSVNWFKLVWFKHCIPKHSFSLWVATWGRLPTKDRLRSWGMTVTGNCVMCDDALETMGHLFVQCRFARDMWSMLQFGSDFHGQHTLSTLFQWALTRSASDEIRAIERYLMGAIVYEIWCERNARVHSKPSSCLRKIVENIRATLREKLIALLDDPVIRQRTTSVLQVWFTIFQVPPAQDARNSLPSS